MRADPEILRQAKTLRWQMSLPERMLWHRLKGRKHDRPKFRRQHPFGHFILDFYCPAARLALEVDGSTHHSDEQAARDRRKDGWLKSQGVRVVRIPTTWVLNNPDGIAERAQALASAMIARLTGGGTTRAPERVVEGVRNQSACRPLDQATEIQGGAE